MESYRIPWRMVFCRKNRGRFALGNDCHRYSRHRSGCCGDRNQAGFVLLIIAFVWTLFATWQLQRSLKAENEMIERREKAGLEEGTELAYSDDEKSSDLLLDEVSGLEGVRTKLSSSMGSSFRLSKRLGESRRNRINPTACNFSPTSHWSRRVQERRRHMAFFVMEMKTSIKCTGINMQNSIFKTASSKFND